MSVDSKAESMGVSKVEPLEWGKVVELVVAMGRLLVALLGFEKEFLMASHLGIWLVGSMAGLLVVRSADWKVDESAS